MSRYLEMLKGETQKNNQKQVPPVLPKLPKPPFDSFDSREGGHICEKNTPLDINEPFPAWCSKSCSCLEELNPMVAKFEAVFGTSCLETGVEVTKFYENLPITDLHMIYQSNTPKQKNNGLSN